MAEPTRDAPPSVRADEDRQNDRLDSWKEIAAYLNRDATTVQRWEKREGMPIHRHLHDRIGSVYASRAELDAWTRSRNLRAAQENGDPASPPIATHSNGSAPPTNDDKETQIPPSRATRSWATVAAIFVCVLLVAAGWFVYTKWRASRTALPVQRALTRLTSDDGLQTGATWSPDGRFIAYASDRGGKYDIWIQQISGGDPIQITKGPAENWMPNWSPDGKYIAYRSEEGEGGIYITPALGGEGQQRKIASFGYAPIWSPDSSKILLQQTGFLGKKIYVVGLDGTPPREVLANQERNHTVMFSTWHPDGRRITSWVVDEATNLFSADIPTLWTEPIDGGPAVETRFPPELQKQIEAITASGLPPGLTEFRTDFRFAWAPSGKAIFFERTFRGARNIWRIGVDPVTLQATNVERLTTSPGLDAEFAISRDGSKLAFTSEHQQIRGWEFPTNANAGRLTGPGQPVTSPGIEAWSFDLSPDGKKLALCGNRDGRGGPWVKSLPSGREEPVVPDDSYSRGGPLWSPDGKRAAYERLQTNSNKDQVVIWSSESRNESLVGLETPYFRNVSDWSHDGKSLLVVQYDLTSKAEIWQLPIDASESGEASARRIAFDTNYELYQPHMSPDGRWIVFEAVSYQSNSAESTIYTIPSTGGPPGSWTRITDNRQWDDKPRWSPDGKTIYYLSERKGYFNLWGIRFDPVKGRPLGEPFQVTSFESPTLMIPREIPAVDISIAADRLVLPLAQTSGNIWILDNVDR